MNHPGPGDLARYALATNAQEDETIMLHVQSCSDCAFEVRMLREASADLVVASVAPGHRTSACPDGDALAALVDGASSREARHRMMPHLAECARCRQTVAAINAALADTEVRREIAAIRRPVARRARFLVSAAAAAIVLWVAWPPSRGGMPEAHRAAPITAAAEPVAQWPVGSVASARELRWSPVERATRYRVTVFDESGVLVHEWQGAESRAVLPDSLALQPGRRYLWRVEAQTGWDRWSASTLVPFSISPAPRR